MSHPPPRLARALLKRLVPAECRDEALDDLDDLYAIRRDAHGAWRADLWYWRELPSYAVHLRWAALTGAPLAALPLHHPNERAPEPMRTLLLDLRYSVRALLRTPLFLTIAVATLALGVGANTAIFSVVRAVLLRPLPFPAPDRIVELQEMRVGRQQRSSMAHDNFWDLRDLSRSLASVGAIARQSMNLGGQQEPERVTVATASAGFFPALGVTPVLGRLFLPDDDRPGADPRLAVLSHTFWLSHFNGSRDVLDGVLTLDGEGYRIVGVLPPGTPWLDAAEVFAPLVQRPGANRTSWELSVIGRLTPGATFATLQSDLDAAAGRIAEQHPEMAELRFGYDTTTDWVANDGLRRALWILLAAVGFLLLIACVNLANMLLARASGRTRERALRAALGATRGRVVQLAVVEALALGVAGVIAGTGFAAVVLRYLRIANPGDIPRLGDARLDTPVLLVALGAGLLTSLLTGLVPALRVSSDDLVTSLREGERSVAGNRRAGRFRHSLVALEVALSLILLVGAGLLIRSFANVLHVERGFATEDRITFNVGFTSAQTPAEHERQSRELRDFLERIRAFPQVTNAAAVHMRPLRGTGTGLGFGAVDRPDATGNDIPWAGWRLISTDYFRTLGLPLLEGRDFTPSDSLGRRDRVIISRRIAQLLWPGESAVGRQIELWKGQNSHPGEVIGVVGDMRDWGLTNDPSYAVYFPANGVGLSLAHVVVHTTLPISVLVPQLRAALAGIDPSAPLSEVQSMDDLVGDSVASRRFTMFLLASLAGVALLLAAAGIYGVLSYSVSQRRGEVGVRVALGASTSSVLRLVMVQGMTPVVIGVVAGIAGAAALSRFMSSLLFGLTPIDVPTYAGVATLLIGVAALSCYLPARDAMRVDVLTALREE